MPLDYLILSVSESPNYEIGPHGRLHFHADYDSVEEARQAAAASDMHSYQIEDLKTRKVTEKGLVGNLTDMEQ